MKILLFHLGSIGDTIVSIPAIKAIRRHFGSNSTLYLVHDFQSNVIVLPNDVLYGSYGIDHYISYPFKEGIIGKYISATCLWWKLIRLKLDVVVYLAPSERSDKNVRRDKIFFKLCAIPKQIGFHAFTHDFLYPIGSDNLPKRVMHEAQYRLERIKIDGIDITIESDLSRKILEIPENVKESAGQWLYSRRKHPERPLVAICPGAKKPANIWPLERFIMLGNLLNSLDEFELLIIGGPAESDTGEAMVEAWKSGINAAGKTSVLGSAALLDNCKFMIGLDTGTTHLAAALGVPCIVLYGGKDNPGRWEPLGDGHIIFRNIVHCYGCGQYSCLIPGHPCMMGITVDQVWEGILNMLHRDSNIYAKK